MAGTTEFSKIGSKQLNDKERLFVDEYIISLDSKNAAIKAGYSAKSAQTTGCILLKKTKIRREIGKLLREQHEDKQLESGDILEQLYYIITRDIREFVDDRGIALPIHCLSDRAASSVDGFEQDIHEVINPETQEVVSRQIKNKLKLVGKAGAIDMGMKYRGLFAAEKQELTVKGEVSFDFSKLLTPPVASDPVDAAFKALEQQGTIEQSPKEPPLVLEVQKNKDGTRTVKPKKTNGDVSVKRGRGKKT